MTLTIASERERQAPRRHRGRLLENISALTVSEKLQVRVARSGYNASGEPSEHLAGRPYAASHVARGGSGGDVHHDRHLHRDEVVGDSLGAAKARDPHLDATL